MKYLIIPLLLLFNISSYAQNSITTSNKGEVDSKKWYIEKIKKLRNKVNKILNPNKSINISSVFGIRGSKSIVRSEVYWKSGNSEKLNEKISGNAKELDLILKDLEENKNKDAVSSLERFISENKNGYFIKQATDILNTIKKETSGNNQN